MEIKDYKKDLETLYKMKSLYENHTKTLCGTFYSDMMEEINEQIQFCKDCVKNLRLSQMREVLQSYVNGEITLLQMRDKINSLNMRFVGYKMIRGRRLLKAEFDGELLKVEL